MSDSVLERKRQKDVWVEQNPFRVWRKEKGYQAVDFGHIGTPNSMKNWERGDVRPSPEKMLALAEEMEISQLTLEAKWTDWERARPR